MNLEKIHEKDRIFTNIVIINFSLYLIFLIFLLKKPKNSKFMVYIKFGCNVDSVYFLHI